MSQYRLLRLPLAIVAFERIPRLENGLDPIDELASNDAESPGEEWDDLGPARWYGDGSGGFLAVFVGHPIVWYWQVQDAFAAPMPDEPQDSPTGK